MKNTLDKRVIKTRHLIKTTVAKMLKKQNPDDISITDISRQSLIQRATFYNHYANVYEVMYDICGDITKLVDEQFCDIDFSHVKQSVKDIIYGFSAVRRRLEPEYMDFLLSENAAVTVRIRKWFTSSTRAKLEKSQRPLDKFEKYAGAMYVNGLFDAYITWRNESPSKSGEEFIAYAVKVLDNACDFISIR